eukprot:559745-Pelagomonas_calceolata.AAC.1
MHQVQAQTVGSRAEAAAMRMKEMAIEAVVRRGGRQAVKRLLPWRATVDLTATATPSRGARRGGGRDKRSRGRVTGSKANAAIFMAWQRTGAVHVSPWRCLRRSRAALLYSSPSSISSSSIKL